jgi:hypothetical protein
MDIDENVATVRCSRATEIKLKNYISRNIARPQLHKEEVNESETIFSAA